MLTEDWFQASLDRRYNETAWKIWKNNIETKIGSIIDW